MAIRKFNITVDGKVHEVIVEEIGGVAEVTAAPVSTKPVENKPAKPVVSAGPGDINAPLQGTVSAVNVEVGAAVKAGQVVAIIEAMKMENEIVAPADGTVAAVVVKKGDKVSSGDLLLTVK